MSFAALDLFARLSAERARAVRDALGGSGPFGAMLHRELDALFRGPADIARLLAVVEALGPVLSLAQLDAEGELFWDAVVVDARRQSAGRRRSGGMRSLWGVTPINLLRELAEADRRLGHEAETVVFTSYHVTSNFDVLLKPYEAAITSERIALWVPFHNLVLVWALLRYDNFHLFNDAGLSAPTGGYGSNMGIALREMDLYRAAGKQLYTYAYGADHRMRQKTLASGRFNFCMECPEPGRFCVCDDAGGERMLAEIASRSTEVVATGLSMEQIPGARNLYYTVVDTDLMKPAPAPDSAASRPLRVGHFPNHGYFKGTKYLQDAVAKLQAEGEPIELDMISGVPQTEILARMATVDVLVDQLISGAFGLTAIEAMALGRPVIGHLRADVALADLDACPIIRADPDTIDDVLRKLLRERDTLPEIGTQSRDYVVQHYSVDVFARRLASLYADTAALSEPHRERLRAIAGGDAPLPGASGLPAPAQAGWPLALTNRVAEPVRAAIALRKHLFARSTAFFRSLPRVARSYFAVGVYLIKSRSIRALVWVSEVSLRRLAVPLGRRRTAARLAQGAPRSLWGVTPILTLPLKARADRLLGFQSQTVVTTTYYISSQFDVVLRPWVEWMNRNFLGLLYPFERFLLSWVIWRYDVVHLFYDRGFFSPATRWGISPDELSLLRAAGKRVYLYAYGADVRRRAPTLELGKWNFCKECPEPGTFCACSDDNEPIMVAMSDKATSAVALGDMLVYVPHARNMHYWPIDLAKFSELAPPRIDGPLRIAHAPNHTHFKGSHYLEAAIEKLRAQGHAIEYVKVHGVPNHEVLRLFGEADLVADQFIGGAYGYTALEAMACGRPVLTYVRSPDLVEAVDECPMINTTPDTLGEVLLWCLSNRERLAAIGAQGAAYVRRWHGIEAVAERFGRMYEETAAFPEASLAPIREQRSREAARRAAEPQASGWDHPWRIR